VIIHFIRHGESVWHSNNQYSGITDIALSEHGKIQAEMIATWVDTNRQFIIFTSALRRAMATAQPIAKKLGIEPIIEKRLNEVDFGDVEGLTPTEWANRFPENRKDFINNPATTCLPNGERGTDALERANEFLVDLVTKKEVNDKEILIFCHGTILRLILCSVLGIELDGYRRRFPMILNGLSTTLDLTYVRGDNKIEGSLFALNYTGLPTTQRELNGGP
jgi:probable phosphoglycerate mutase